MPNACAPWWTELYDDHVAAALLERADDQEVARTVAFLVHVLDLGPNARVFDQCCGIGSFALGLAARGYEVVGVDQCATYVARAASQAPTNAQFWCADAREFVATPRCLAGLNWWTSFGYSADEEDNLRMLQAARASLLPGSCYVLDTMNAPQVLRAFAPVVRTERATPAGPLRLVRTSTIDLATGMLHKQWAWTLPDGSQLQRPSAVRLYLPCDLAALLRRAGFVNVRFFGAVDGQPLTLDSPRCIAVAQVPR